MKNELYFACLWCSFESTRLEERNKHIIEDHRNRIITDYDDATGEWSFWRPVESTVFVDV